MKTKVLWLKASYLTAAIADFLVAVSVLIPERVGLDEFVYPMGLMSAVAFSWGILLLLAIKKPEERRWILLPTIIVVALLDFVQIYCSYLGMIESRIIFIVAGLLILLLLVYSFFTTREPETKNEPYDFKIPDYGFSRQIEKP